MKLERRGHRQVRSSAPVPLERDEQAHVVAWFRANYREYRGCLIASGNGLHIGGNTPGQKAAHWARFVATGGQKGVSDLFLMVPRGSHSGLFIEMKRKTGRPSDVTDEEFAFIGLALRMGYQATWCAGAHEAVAVIEEYMANGDPQR